MRQAIVVSVLVLLVHAVLPSGEAAAQADPERLRVEAITGVFLQGEIAKADFIADFTNFGGQLVQRSDGFLDVDPSVWFGFRGSYRMGERWELAATWMHSQGRFRVQFPAEASIAGNFDLEGLLLAGDDFATGGQEGLRAERAMSDAVTDLYMVSGTYEFPVLSGWAFPYLTGGLGILTQKSLGNVIDFEYEGDLPAFVEAIENAGASQAAAQGLSEFRVNEKNPVATLGAGIRVAVSPRWSLNLRFEDVIRIGVDMTEIDASSTPPPDPDRFVLYSSTFRGVNGNVHSAGVQFSVNYSLWPYGAPR